MKNKIILLVSSLFLITCSIKKDNEVFVNPTESLKVEFNLTTNKTPYYKVFYENNVVIDSAHLGIIMEQSNFYNDLITNKINGYTKNRSQLIIFFNWHRIAPFLFGF